MLYCGAPAIAVADDLYWNAGGTIGDGSGWVATDGTWSTSVSDWTNSDNTAAASPWTNQSGMHAYFLGEDSAHSVTYITIDGTVQFDTITIGLTPSGQFTGSSLTYTFSGGELQMAPTSGDGATINIRTPFSQLFYTSIHDSADGSATNLYITDNTDNPQFLGGGFRFLGDQAYTGTTYLQNKYTELGGANAEGTAYLTASLQGAIVISDGSEFVVWSGTNGDATLTAANVISSENSGNSTAILSIAGQSTGANNKVILNSDSSAFKGQTGIPGILSGSGSLGGDVTVEAGGQIYNTQGSTLTLGDTLTLDPQGQVGPPPFTTVPPALITADLVEQYSGQALFATGDLDVHQGTMTVNVTGNAQVYNIIRYTGTLTGAANTIFAQAATITGVTGNYGLDVVDPGSGTDEPGMVRLLIYDGNGQIGQYWNGGGSGGSFVGGNGTWNVARMNWAAGNSTPAQESAWAKSVGIFDGTGGTVTVDGTLGFDRLEFAVSDYTVNGGSGTALLLSPYSASSGKIAVDNGSDVATIGVDIGNGNNYSALGAGALVNTLEKTGAGTLAFTGTKSYTGLTTVSAGTLQLGDGSATGGVTGDVTVASGARFGGAGSAGGSVAINSGATLFGAQGGVLAISGDLSFQSSTSIDAGLTAPSSTALFTSNTLTLGGAGATTINLSNAGISSGLYALIDAGTAPSVADPASQFVIGANLPSGTTVQYSPVGHVYLNVPGPTPVPELSYWDGTTVSGTAAIAGGNGTWNTYVSGNTNWGDADPPTTHGVWSQGDIAVFTGSAGTVTVDTNGGASGVQAGGLHFAQTGYVVTGDELTLDAATSDNLAEIAVGPAAGTVATISSVMNGASGINKTGAGTLVLSAANTYAGDTRLTGGVLSVAEDANLGGSASSVAFAGGTLQASASFETTRVMTLDMHGGTIAVENGGDTLTVSGAISDEAGSSGGMLQKVGAGALVLSATNSYSGGTAVRAGTLSVGSDQNLGASAGGILLDGGTLSASSGFNTGRTFELTDNGGTVDVVNGADTLAASGSFVDSTNKTGSLTKTGAGMLLMTADNTYSGQTTISEGTLQLGSNGATGAIAGDVAVASGATFTVWRSADWAFGGALSGSGSFNQMGAATITLSADSSGFVGTTSVTGGGLAVTGKLGGMIDVSGNGLLSGNGMLGAVAINQGGRVTAGTSTSIDTLSTGTLSFAPGSGLLVNVLSQDNDGLVTVEGDLLQVGGEVNIAGGNVTVDAQGGTVVDGTTVTIIDSSTSVNTSDGDGDGAAGFDPTVISTSAYVDATIGYTSDTVFLTLKDLTNHGDTLCLPGMTANQCGTAQGINSLGPESPLPSIIKGLPSDQLGPALDQLSGEAYSSYDTAMLDNSRYIREATNARMRQTHSGPEMPQTSVVSSYAETTQTAAPLQAEQAKAGAWMTAYGSWNDYSSDGDAAGMKNNVGGVFVGADMPVFDNVRFGAVIGYGSSSYDVSARNSSANSNDWTLGLYGGGQWDNWQANVGTAYTWHDVSASRQVVIPGLTEQEDANYDAGTFQVYTDVAYMIEAASNVDIGPYFDGAYVHQQTDGFNETGGYAALGRDASEMNTGFTTLGLRTSYALGNESFAGQLVASVGWRHAYGDLNGAGALAFSGGSVFNNYGVPVAEDQAVINLGFQTTLNENFDIEVNYAGQFGNNYQSQNIVGQLNLRF